MKKLVFLFFAATALIACNNSGKTASDVEQTDSAVVTDSSVTVVGEWVQEPMVEGQSAESVQAVKLNEDKTAQTTTPKIDASTVIYQAWDQQGDTLTLISQDAINPKTQDTVSWAIISLTADSLILKNPKMGVTKYIRKK